MCAYCSLVDLWSPGASERRCILMYFCSIYFLRDPRFWSIDCFLCSSALLSSLHYFVQTLRSQGPVCMDMGWAEWSNGSGGKTKFSALPLSVSGLCCFPSSHVLAEYLVGTLPGTLQWKKGQILIPTVSAAVLEIPYTLCCWVIVNISKKISAGLFINILPIFVWDMYF